jgi:hypothetical protein
LHAQSFCCDWKEDRAFLSLHPRKVAVYLANRAWTNMTSTEQRSLGIVSVGNPDSRVADGRPYTTLTNDIIIRPIPFALPANTSNGGFTFADVTGHQFVSSYLAAGSNSRTRILDHLRNAIETVESPTAGAGDGVITVTLNWGSQPDVDLHVFEPDGTHVYYASRSGLSGSWTSTMSPASDRSTITPPARPCSPEPTRLA